MGKLESGGHGSVLTVRDADLATAVRMALEMVEEGSVVAVGSGRSAEMFARQLAGAARRPQVLLSWSPVVAALLEADGFETAELNRVGAVDLCVDGIDECTESLTLLRGVDGYVARGKTAAAAAREFVAIAASSALAGTLDGARVAVEVLSYARSLAARGLVGLGGDPILREGFETDGGNRVIDCLGLDLRDAAGMERAIKMLPGVVDCGISAVRPADVILLACDNGVKRLGRRR